MSDVAIPELSRAEGIFKDLAWNTLIQALMAQYGLSWWPMSSVFTLISDKIFEGLRLNIDLPAIVFKNEMARKTFDHAQAGLLLLERDHGLDSPEYKTAKEEAKSAMSALVRFGAA